ncbi:hypothetical protein ABZ636_39630 [Streptomyces sp. NPDC007251]|uniref:hypothetical protein n=1 Tax=Streptomyces sp. NPDC007251 TaxID=3154483 RepID=UPI0034023B2B
MLAATFAASGVRGAADAIEGELGLLHGYSHEPRAEALTAGLGSDSRRLTHGGVDAALVARRELRGAPNPGARVRLAISPAAAMLVGGDDPRKRAPQNSVDGQFSAVFQTAVALLDGRVDWNSYQRIADTDVLATHRRDRARHRRLAAGSRRGCDGRRRRARSNRPHRSTSGEPGTSLSWQPVRTKYEGLTDHRLPDRVADAIAGLASVPSVRTLLRDLRTPLIQEQP